MAGAFFALPPSRYALLLLLNYALSPIRSGMTALTQNIFPHPALSIITIVLTAILNRMAVGRYVFCAAGRNHLLSRIRGVRDLLRAPSVISSTTASPELGG